MAGKKPTAALVLSLIGGILILIGGIGTLWLAGQVGGLTALNPLAGIMGSLVAVGGAVGVVFGIIIMALGALLWKKPNKHVAFGVVILALSIISLIDGGGFILGFILGLVGGILALVWKG